MPEGWTGLLWAEVAHAKEPSVMQMWWLGVFPGSSLGGSGGEGRLYSDLLLLWLLRLCQESLLQEEQKEGQPGQRCGLGVLYYFV